MFDNKVAIQNSSESSISLPYAKTIFVMEDVDGERGGAGREATRACSEFQQVSRTSQRVFWAGV